MKDYQDFAHMLDIDLRLISLESAEFYVTAFLYLYKWKMSALCRQILLFIIQLVDQSVGGYKLNISRSLSNRYFTIAVTRVGLAEADGLLLFQY